MLVLLPPIGLGPSCWDRIDLQNAVTPSYPGLGSRPPATSDYALEDLADEIAAEFTGPLDIVGVSMGGMVAQHLALPHPEQVQSMVLANTTGFVPPEPPLERATLADTNRTAELIEQTLALWFTPELLASESPADVVGYARRTLQTLDSESFARGWRAIAGHSVLDDLARLTMPVTCVAGDADVSTPPEVVEELRARIPDSTMVTVPGPHLLLLERPEVFRQAVVEHLGRTSPSRAAD